MGPTENSKINLTPMTATEVRVRAEGYFRAKALEVQRERFDLSGCLNTSVNIVVADGESASDVIATELARWSERQAAAERQANVSLTLVAWSISFDQDSDMRFNYFWRASQ